MEPFWSVQRAYPIRSRICEREIRAVPISNFGAPIYGQFSFGWGTTLRALASVFIALGRKEYDGIGRNFVTKAAFGVDTGATWRFEAGAKITLNYTQEVQR